jgi:hypothetical protein
VATVFSVVAISDLLNDLFSLMTNLRERTAPDGQ